MHTHTAPTSAEWGTALLRISPDVMFLAHSLVLKLLTYGLPGTAALLQHVGLPGWLVTGRPAALGSAQDAAKRDAAALAGAF